MMAPFEVWEVPEVCPLESMDDSMDDVMDQELEQLQKLSQLDDDWVVCDIPPMVRFDHEQERLEQQLVEHHVQHQRDLEQLDQWARDGFDEGLQPMECDVQDFLDHPDADNTFWTKWNHSIHAICSVEEQEDGDGIPADLRGAVKAGTYDPLRALRTPPELLQLPTTPG